MREPVGPLPHGLLKRPLRVRRLPGDLSEAACRMEGREDPGEHVGGLADEPRGFLPPLVALPLLHPEDYVDAALGQRRLPYVGQCFLHHLLVLLVVRQYNDVEDLRHVLVLDLVLQGNHLGVPVSLRVAPHSPSADGAEDGQIRRPTKDIGCQHTGRAQEHLLGNECDHDLDSHHSEEAHTWNDAAHAGERAPIGQRYDVAHRRVRLALHLRPPRPRGEGRDRVFVPR
mmetsp:Transcript_33930/g.97691  ORF Transcript_33930/g.97691 Transcript_33930/m.97691 type:complete len:228 (+) Transcript_33930:1428-2111(+)